MTNTNSRDLLQVTSGFGDDGMAIIKAQGELDLSTAGLLHEPLLKSLADGSHVLVDLTQVSFIDSSGIAALVGAFRTMNGSGGMSVLISPESQLARVFKLAEMGQALPIFTDRTEAMVGLSPRGAAG